MPVSTPSDIFQVLHYLEDGKFGWDYRESERGCAKGIWEKERVNLQANYTARSHQAEYSDNSRSGSSAVRR